jgi:dipeptidyl aminopeptidase/acylaminoacyl peptidase
VFLVGGFKPSPDGTQIVLTYRREGERNAQFRGEVAIVDVKTGALRNLTKNQAPEGDAQFSPDGKTVSFTAPSDAGWELATSKLFLVPASGGRPEQITTDYTGAIGDYYWAKDGRSIIFGGMRNGRGGAYRLSLAGGKVDTIVTGDFTGGMDSVSADHRYAAGVISTPSRPGEIGVLDMTTGQSKLITDVNPKVRGLELADFRAVTWKSTDGLEVEGMLWLPKGHKGGKLPLIVSVHGGPAGVWSTSFRAINHVYAGLGWAVLEPNVRGSSSYGDALLRGNMKDIGGGDYQDLMTGVDALVAQGLADPGHLAIRGWSYGGILGGWTITQTDRFKAASLGAMVSDWTSEYAMGFNHDIRLWYIGGAPWENPEAYRRQSAYTHIAKVKTPTIIIHGEEDTTDTIGQSMMYYQGLKDRGVPVRFLRFPREPHGFNEPAHQRARDTEEIAWLMKHARGIDWKAPERGPSN